MPTEARTGLVEGWILDNPWPLSILLFAAALGLFFLAVRLDDRRMIRFAAGAAIAGLATLAIGLAVETPGETARDRTRGFVEAATEGRIDDMLRILHEDATLHVARVGNPGFSRSTLDETLDGLRSRHRIQDNSITRLDSSESPDGAVWVELGCMTRTDSTGGWVPSRWILEWQESDSDGWRIRSITALKIAGVVPRDSGILR